MQGSPKDDNSHQCVLAATLVQHLDRCRTNERIDNGALLLLLVTGQPCARHLSVGFSGVSALNNLPAFPQDAMSDAIEGAEILLYGVSQRYKESVNVSRQNRCLSTRRSNCASDMR